MVNSNKKPKVERTRPLTESVIVLIRRHIGITMRNLAYCMNRSEKRTRNLVNMLLNSHRITAIQVGRTMHYYITNTCIKCGCEVKREGKQGRNPYYCDEHRPYIKQKNQSRNKAKVK